MVSFCVVCKCKADRRPELMFHTFPKDETLRQKWIDQLGIQRKVGKSATICSIHFSQDCFKPALVSGKPVLIKGSIPTILSLEEFIKRETVDKEDTDTLRTEHETQSLNNVNTTRQASPFESIMIKEEIKAGNEAHDASSKCEILKEPISLTEINRNDEVNEKMIEELQYSCRKILVKDVNLEQFCGLPEALKGMYWMEAQHLIKHQASELKKLQQRNRRYKKKIETLTIFTQSMKREIAKRARKTKID